MKKVYKNKEELIRGEIGSQDSVLDIGFLGHGVTQDNSNWPHKIVKEQAGEVWGLDLKLTHEFRKPGYIEASAENFNIGRSFDVVFAGDLIEHLSNPGLFLQCAAQHLNSEGRLIITTPNCFSLFNIAEKFSKYEPTVNSDHTVYFNFKTLSQLLGKNGWVIEKTAYIYSLNVDYKESFKKKFLNLVYRLVSYMSPKFLETIVVIAKKQ